MLSKIIHPSWFYFGETAVKIQSQTSQNGRAHLFTVLYRCVKIKRNVQTIKLYNNDWITINCHYGTNNYCININIIATLPTNVDLYGLVDIYEYTSIHHAWPRASTQVVWSGVRRLYLSFLFQPIVYRIHSIVTINFLNRQGG